MWHPWWVLPLNKRYEIFPVVNPKLLDLGRWVYYVLGSVGKPPSYLNYIFAKKKKKLRTEKKKNQIQRAKD